MVSYVLAKLGGHRHCDSGATRYLIFHVTSLYQMTEGSCDIMDMVRFGGRRYCGSKDIMLFVCHVISQHHVIKGSCDFMGEGSVTTQGGR